MLTIMHNPEPARKTQDEAEVIADRLHSAAIHLLRRLRREDTKSGLSAPRLSALSVLVFGGPVTLGELANAEQVRPPTMTRLISALEAEGLVSREADPDDGRLTRIRATPKGRALLPLHRGTPVEYALRAQPVHERGAGEHRVPGDHGRERAHLRRHAHR